MAFAETPANLKVDREFIRKSMNAPLLSREHELISRGAGASRATRGRCTS